MMTWTLETPTEGGWYWCHLYRMDAEPFLVKIVMRGGVALLPHGECATDLIARWSGPIHPPELP